MVISCQFEAQPELRFQLRGDQTIPEECLFQWSEITAHHQITHCILIHVSDSSKFAFYFVMEGTYFSSWYSISWIIYPILLIYCISKQLNFFWLRFMLQIFVRSLMSSCSKHEECNSKRISLPILVIVQVIVSLVTLSLIQREIEGSKVLLILAFDVRKRVTIKICGNVKNLGLFKLFL